MEDGNSCDLELLKSAVLEGGQVALDYFKNDPEVWYKDSKSPVSQADMAVDRFMVSKLMNARPSYGWLSEESADSDERMNCENVFVVDPIDGTREFLAGTDIWSVSAAIVQNGRPYAAAIYNPLKEELFEAQLDKGAWLNQKPISVSNLESLEGGRISAPRRIRNHKAWSQAGISSRIYIGSLAYRLAMIASGQLEAVVAKATAHDWDVAAADLIIQEAGGKLVDTKNKHFTYNKSQTTHPAFVAAPLKLHERVMDAAIVSLKE